jgi:hypothetical protein
MAEHLTEEQIEHYRRRQNDPAARQECDLHLTACDDCLRRVLDSAHAALAFNSLSEAFLPSLNEKPFHLSHAELKSYRAGTATSADRIICESHLEICDQCSAELGSLTTTLPSAGIWSWQAWGLTPARVTVAIALFAFLVLAIVVWRQRSPSTLREDSARTNSPAELAPSSPQPSSSNTETQTDNFGQSNLATLKDNDREIRLDQGGKLTGLEDLDESSQRMARAALAGEALAKPNVLNDLSSPPIKLLGESPDESVFQLVSPLGKVISEQRPILKWQSLSGATSYSVSVFDANFNRVTKSPTLLEPAWILPEPLKRGETYSWEVTATRDGREIKAPVAPAPRAQFRVLEGDKLNALTRLKRQRPASHLALGLAYARFGLVPEAEGEFRQLLKQNPESALAKKLLRTVQSWR